MVSVHISSINMQNMEGTILELRLIGHCLPVNGGATEH
jgi:hypothetical protein